MKLSITQVRALYYGQEGLTDMGAMLLGIRKRTLDILKEQGLIRYQPYSKPDPLWKTTKAGKEALARIEDEETKKHHFGRVFLKRAKD